MSTKLWEFVADCLPLHHIRIPLLPFILWPLFEEGRQNGQKIASKWKWGDGQQKEGIKWMKW